MRPTDPTQRVELIDALRGFALFGVCLANLFVFSYSSPDALTDVFVEGKFYSIFSLLFGLGFALQLKDEARLPTYRRRIRILMMIGFLHLMLLWLGDILLFYALMALILMRMRHISDEKALKYATLFVFMPVIQFLPSMIHFLISPAFPFFLGAFGMSKLYHFDINNAFEQAYQWSASGHIVDWFKLSTTGIWFRYADLLHTGRPWKVLAMFLVGMVIGRRRLWENLDAYAPLLRRVALWGFALGLPANIAMLRYREGLANSVLYALGVAPLALAFAASFALLWRTRARGALRLFAPAGKLALTNYLSQTVIATIIYSGFGFGLARHVGAPWMWVEAILTLSLQIAFSQWWLAHYKFGPMEWLWRSLTYGERQPMKLSQRKPNAPGILHGGSDLSGGDRAHGHVRTAAPVIEAAGEVP